MRPKKVVLCVSPCEFRLSRQAFLLETRGYRVLRADSSADALEVLACHEPPAIDVLVSELEMSDMDGNELTRRAKQLRPGLPVMLLSYAIREFSESSRELWADVFLAKGQNSSAEVVERVRVLATRRRGPKKKIAPGVTVHAAAAVQAVA